MYYYVLYGRGAKHDKPVNNDGSGNLWTRNDY